MFIMLDGIDGSGKSTILQIWKNLIAQKGNAIFDLKKYWQTANRYPEFSEVKPYDFIFSCEPTRLGIGKIILEELITQPKLFSGRTVAEAYALDRLVLYQKIIIPALRDQKTIIQDRGLSSSLAYQPLYDKKLTKTAIIKLAGNRLALKHAPDHLVIMDIKPETAIDRLRSRMNKKDGSVFEKLNFLKRLNAIFHSEAYLKYFKNRGTKIHFLSANNNIDIMRLEAERWLQNLLKL